MNNFVNYKWKNAVLNIKHVCFFFFEINKPQVFAKQLSLLSMIKTMKEDQMLKDSNNSRIFQASEILLQH